MDTFAHVPPGFRFHPTDEELVDYYLRKKVASRRIDLDIIKDVDLYKIEPWDLQERCKIGTEEQNEWYFFSHKDKKYPTGTRTNRATRAGFWKATGRDKPIYSKRNLVGMRKTLVFYKGRAPNGQKSDWIMHEYRLETNENAPPQEEGWVVCRVFKKRITPIRRLITDHDSPCSWPFDDHVASFMPELDSPEQPVVAAPPPPPPPPSSSSSELPPYHHHPLLFPCKPELELHYHLPHHHHDSSFLQLPQLKSPNKLPIYGGPATAATAAATELDHQDLIQSNTKQQLQYLISSYNNTAAGSSSSNQYQTSVEQVTDWRVFDKLVASQLSHDDFCKQQPDCSNSADAINGDHANSTSNSSSAQIELWK